MHQPGTFWGFLWASFFMFPQIYKNKFSPSFLSFVLGQFLPLGVSHLMASTDANIGASQILQFQLPQHIPTVKDIMVNVEIYLTSLFYFNLCTFLLWSFLWKSYYIMQEGTQWGWWCACVCMWAHARTCVWIIHWYISHHEAFLNYLEQKLQSHSWKITVMFHFAVVLGSGHCLHFSTEEGKNQIWTNQMKNYEIFLEAIIWCVFLQRKGLVGPNVWQVHSCTPQVLTKPPMALWNPIDQTQSMEAGGLPSHLLTLWPSDAVCLAWGMLVVDLLHRVGVLHHFQAFLDLSLDG